MQSTWLGLGLGLGLGFEFAPGLRLGLGLGFGLGFGLGSVALDAIHLHALDGALARRPADETQPHAGQLPLHILPAVLEEPLDACAVLVCA